MNPLRLFGYAPLATLALIGLAAAAWCVDQIGVILGSVLAALFQF